ncbi:acyl-CoA dehydrogenase family protein [Janibacter melonis]|uniref:acyl-CoA dehydrogenase family protein n=1 Tax=Janibacter melonis TaxID=262209 RepID=UPI00178055FE|nr:acyl-CoA dehydrogenase family protein [Janibacter melonis]MBD5831657.1 acyl-CoA dehydrogenase [Janibacter melonis]MCB5992209.1 acyl-CoA dehydrogenase family protein [Janibacter melonis]
MESTEFDEVLATVATLVEKVVVPAEDEIESTDAIPEHVRRAAADMGLFGYALPEEYGGLGLTMSEEVRLAMVIGRTTPAFRSMFGTNNGIAGQVLVNFGTDEQKQTYLPGLAAGELVASFALTEPDAGSDPSGLRTKAVRDGDDYVISGQKRYITNAPQADLFMVFARTGDVSEGTKGISVFVVDASLEGVTVGPKDAKMGQRGAHTAEVYLDEVRVGAECLVGGVEGEGFSAAMRSLAKGRLHIGALCVGLAERLTHEALQHSLDQTQGGARIADFQLVQGMLADCRTETMAGRALVLEAARAYDDGSDRRLGPSAAKLYCSEMVDRVADRAVQVHGGMGYMQESKVSRFYRDARLFRLYEGTSEIQRTIIAKQMIRGASTR